VIELKTVTTITEIHQAQLMNYLIACNKRCGLIINFGKPRIEIKRMVIRLLKYLFRSNQCLQKLKIL